MKIQIQFEANLEQQTLEMFVTDLVIIRNLLSYFKTNFIIKSLLDSVENAKEEIKFFFEDFDIERWYTNNETYFALKKVTFNEKTVEHVANLT